MNQVSTKEQFVSDVLNVSGPVLVDFFAERCGPCRFLAPVVEELSNEYAGKVKVVKLDVDEVPEIAGQFNVMSIPTIIIFNNGHMVGQPLVGVMPKEQYQAILNGLVGSQAPQSTQTPQSTQESQTNTSAAAA